MPDSGSDVVIFELSGIQGAREVRMLKEWIEIALEKGPVWALLDCKNLEMIDGYWIRGFDECLTLAHGRIKFFAVRVLNVRRMLLAGRIKQLPEIYDSEEEARVACFLDVRRVCAD